jgi:hypothetical protein
LKGRISKRSEVMGLATTSYPRRGWVVKTSIVEDWVEVGGLTEGVGFDRVEGLVEVAIVLMLYWVYIDCIEYVLIVWRGDDE